MDTNRNWPTNWNFDLEGASADPANETYHGTGPASEPEVQAMRGLERRIGFKFQIDYHSFAQLILYPEGWQVETLASDSPLMAAIAGDDDNPAVAGLRPGRLGGAVHDQRRRHRRRPARLRHAGLHRRARRRHRSGRGRHRRRAGLVQPGRIRVPGLRGRRPGRVPEEPRVLLDLARSAKDPANPVSHLGNKAPEFVPTTFPISYGDPQTVEVNAKKSLGRVRVYWQVNGGRVHWGPTREYQGGQRRYYDPGTYYHHLRGVVKGTKPGDTVKVWFQAGRKHGRTRSRTRPRRRARNKVLLWAPRTTPGRARCRPDGPEYLDDYAQALQAAHIGYDVYDVDAQSAPRRRRSACTATTRP